MLRPEHASISIFAVARNSIGRGAPRGDKRKMIENLRKKKDKKSITSIDNSVKRRKATSTGLGPEARPRGLSRPKNAYRSSTRYGLRKTRPCLGLADRRVLNPHQKGSSSREAKPGVAVIMGSEQWENASAKKEQAKDEQKKT